MGRKASSAAGPGGRRRQCAGRWLRWAEEWGEIRGGMARKRAISARIGGIYGGFLSRNHPRLGLLGPVSPPFRVVAHRFLVMERMFYQASCDLRWFPAPVRGHIRFCAGDPAEREETLMRRVPDAARPPSRAAAQPRPPTNSAAASARPRRPLHAAGRAGVDRRHPRSQGGGPAHCGGAALCAKPPAGGAGGATSLVSGGGHHRPPPDTGSAMMPMLA